MAEERWTVDADYLKMKPYYWHRKLAQSIEEIENFAYRRGLKQGREERHLLLQSDVLPRSLIAMLDLIDDRKHWKHKHTPTSRYEKRFGKIVMPDPASVNAFLKKNKLSEQFLKLTLRRAR